MVVAGAGTLRARGVPEPIETGAQQAFYDPSTVQTVHLEISPDNLNRLQAALPERIFVPGRFRWARQIIEDVGIRYKGNSSSHPRSDLKRSYLIKFSEYRKGQRLFGLRRVALDNGIQFGSLFSERLITDVLRDLGVPASRCNYATLYLNGQYRGVYVNVERIDESFLDRQFGEATGPLFKVDEGGPGADLQYLGEDLRPYQKTFELQSEPTVPPYGRLLDFLRALNRPAGGEAPLALERLIDLDAFLQTMAVLLLAGAFDQYTGWGPHNYYLYQRPTDQRWVYLPWDLDVGFAAQAFGRVPVLDGWHAAWPVPVPGRPLLERIVAEPTLLARYRQVAGAVLEQHFRPEILIPKLRGLYAQIREDLARDPFPPRRATNPADTGYESILASMEDFIRQRYTLARAQLVDPGPRPAPTPPPGPHGPPPHPGRPPAPGPPSEDAPTQLRVVAQEPGRVELGWVDQATGEVAFIVQKAVGAAGAEYANALGLPGENLTRAIDHDVRPGATYRYRVYAIFPTPEGPRGTGVSNAVTVTIPAEP